LIDSAFVLTLSAFSLDDAGRHRLGGDADGYGSSGRMVHRPRFAPLRQRDNPN
jgi:hypothetical protein